MDAELETATTADTSISNSTPEPVIETSGAPEPAITESSTPVEGAEGTETPAFTPNLKYTSNLEEKEIPEDLRPFITDEKSEKRIKELLEKSDGLDFVKKKHEAVRGERDGFKKEATSLKDAISDVREVFQRGDIDLFLTKLGIKEERMLQWALEKVNYSKMTPEQRQLVDEKRSSDRQVYEQQKVLKQTSEQGISREASFLQQTLQYELAKPDVTNFQSSFDAAFGKPGAFYEQVRKQGELHWARTKEILPAETAIKEVMDLYGKVVKPVSAAPQVPKTPGIVTATPAAKGTPSTIPNVAGKSASPLNTGPKSIDDLKKTYKEKYGS